MKQGPCMLVLAVALTGSAQAQLNTFDIIVSNPISPQHPAATVEVWAVWDPAQYAFWAAYFDLVTPADSGGFSDPHAILRGPKAKDGFVDPSGDEVHGIVATQVHLPDAGLFADLDNPILLWQVTWSTDDFTPRNVNVFSMTTDFDLYIGNDGTGQGFIDEFVEASATIQVVPAPGCAAVLVIGAAFGSRRRR